MHALSVPFTVPQPIVSLISDTPNPILSGSFPTLTCTVEFDPEVDVPVIIKTVWTGPDKTSSTNTVMNSLTLYTPSLEMEWLGPGGTLIEEGSGVTIMGPSSTTEETLINMLVFSNIPGWTLHLPGEPYHPRRKCY